MSVSDRQQFILQSLVDEYISSTRPVGSSALLHKGALDVSPATIRNDMQELEEQGYLYQPHTSAGRVPTNAGYRLYVDLLQDQSKSRKQAVQHQGVDQLARNVKQFQERYHAFSQALTHAIAQKTAHVVIDIQDADQLEVAHSGFSYLLREPEFRDASKASMIADALDHFEEFAESVQLNSRVREAGEVSIVIGEENPIESLRECSMLAVQCELQHTQRMVLLIGPTRMNYRANVKTLEAIARLLSTGIIMSACILFIIQ